MSLESSIIRLNRSILPASTSTGGEEEKEEDEMKMIKEP